MSKKNNGSSGPGQLLIPLIALGILVLFNVIRDIGFFSITL